MPILSGRLRQVLLYYLGDIGELEGLRIELEDSRDMLEQEKRSRTNLERKLQELEQILDDQRVDSENIQHTLTAKVCSSFVKPRHEISTNNRERSGSVVVLVSRLRGCGFEPHWRYCVVSLSKNINPSLVLVQPRKTRPFITEKLLIGRKESNQTKQTKDF